MAALQAWKSNSADIAALRSALPWQRPPGSILIICTICTFHGLNCTIRPPFWAAFRVPVLMAHFGAVTRGKPPPKRPSENRGNGIMQRGFFRPIR